MSWLGDKLTRIKYVRTAIASRADLSLFSRRPDRRTAVGLILVGGGLLLGWPGASLALLLAALLSEPVLAIYVAPSLYVFSWIPYLVGIWIGGQAAMAYLRDFNRWLVRVVVEKGLGGKVPAVESVELEAPDADGEAPAEPSEVGAGSKVRASSPVDGLSRRP